MVISDFKRLPATLCLALLMAARLTGPVRAEAEKPIESGIKVAYLYNFAKFVTWPSSTTASGDFCIGVLGDDPFHHALDTILAGKTAQGKPLSVRHFQTAHEAASCQIVYVTLPSPSRREVLEALGSQPVLTVGEGAVFVQEGGVISFERLQNTVRFDINLTAAEKAQLKISSQLSKVARRVLGAPTVSP